MGNFEGGDSLIACTFFLTGYASRLVWTGHPVHVSTFDSLQDAGQIFTNNLT